MKNLIDTYRYKDIDGTVVFEKQRYEPKGFSVRRLKDGQWVNNLNGIEPILYNLPKIVRDNTVYIVEGEKDANNLTKMRYTATSPPFEAGKWDKTFNHYFKDKKSLYHP